jgi:predicted metal-dependent HD superfamily phosphohydrolase
MNYEKATKHIAGFVSHFFFNRVDPRYCFHQIQQTEYVLRSALRIAKSFRLSKRDIFLLTAATWFQNTGYCRGDTGHEERSCEVGAEFLNRNKIPTTDTGQICRLILSTRSGQQPADMLEKILADANYYYFGCKSFTKWNDKLYKEHQFLQSNDFLSMEAWQKEMIQMMTDHRFHTTYCRLKLAKQKIINIKTLAQQNMKESDDKSSTMIEKVQSGKPEKNKKKKTEKGVDTMFKIASSNSQRLSSMADNKAHILITVNSIILSAIISLLIRKLDTDTYLIIPTIIILGVSLTTMIFAILATRPDISKGTFQARDLASEDINLLFFGNFYKMPLREYEKGMIQMMESSDFLYGALIRDAHTQGGVLGRKYRQLRLAYNIFMFGLIISVCAFLLTVMLHTPQPHY